MFLELWMIFALIIACGIWAEYRYFQGRWAHVELVQKFYAKHSAIFIQGELAKGTPNINPTLALLLVLRNMQQEGLLFITDQGKIKGYQNATTEIQNLTCYDEIDEIIKIAQKGLDTGQK